jgi:RNA polymerase sigma-70 factor (ECF subfamily)
MTKSARMERPTSADGEPLERAIAPEPSRRGGPCASDAQPSPADADADTEHDLIRRAQKGEEAAFEALVRHHQQRAFRIARNMVPSDEDARDLAQDAFLRVFKSLDRFDFQYTFATWLHRIVTNLAIDHLRKRRLIGTTSSSGDDEEADIDIVDQEQPQPSRRLEAKETSVRVRECIGALAPHFQAVLTLRELEGLACTEIAKIVGATHVTVRWRLHRGRKLFQEEWERRERARLSGADRDAGQEGSAGDRRPAANSGAAPSVDDFTASEDLDHLQ